MRGVTIITDNSRIHTGDDFDLVQEEKEIGMPDVQSYLVEVPGRNGLLNLTKGLTGGISYKNRTIKLQYLATGRRDNLLEIQDFFNNYHGEFVKIIDDDTPNYYYSGEMEVETKWNNNLLTISLEVNAEPFREHVERTNVSTLLSTEGKDVVINNQGVSVVPTITVRDTAKIIFGNKSYTLSEGMYSINELEMKHGFNIYRVSGSGLLTISYREARL